VLIAHVYGTELDARRAIRTIDAARGPTEVLTLDGRSWEAPTKTWAHPVELRNGTWAVPWKGDRLRAIEGVAVRVGDAPAIVVRERDAVALGVGDRVESVKAVPIKDEPGE